MNRWTAKQFANYDTAKPQYNYITTVSKIAAFCDPVRNKCPPHSDGMEGIKRLLHPSIGGFRRQPTAAPRSLRMNYALSRQSMGRSRVNAADIARSVVREARLRSIRTQRKRRAEYRLWRKAR